MLSAWVESSHRIRAGHALDLGAAGIMFPGIESADQAVQAMRHLRYPPDGDRGVATYNRAYGFGLHPERLQTANGRPVLGIVQIESRLAVDRVEEIAKVPGVHVLLIGARKKPVRAPISACPATRAPRPSRTR